MSVQATVEAKPTREEIEAEIDAARDRLADHIADLVGAVHPRAVLRNAADEARSAFSDGVHELRHQFVDDSGVRVSRIALLGAAMTGVVVFGFVVRSIVTDR